MSDVLRYLTLAFLAAFGAAQSAVTLPESLRAHVKSEEFQIVTAVRGLPLGVRDRLQSMFGVYTLDIADSTAEFQGSGAVLNPKLPTRRLVAAGCSMDHCLVHYERGRDPRTWYVALFRWTPDETRLESGGAAPGRYASVEEVRKALLSGAIKGPVKVW
jgi:hypothetical protein